MHTHHVSNCKKMNKFAKLITLRALKVIYASVEKCITYIQTDICTNVAQRCSDVHLQPEYVVV